MRRIYFWMVEMGAAEGGGTSVGIHPLSSLKKGKNNCFTILSMGGGGLCYFFTIWVYFCYFFSKWGVGGGVEVFSVLMWGLFELLQSPTKNAYIRHQDFLNI